MTGRKPSCADLAAPVCGDCDDCQPVTGRQTTPHTPSCHWYEQAEDGTESCDCGAAGREATPEEGRAHLARLAEIRQKPQRKLRTRVLTAVGYLMYKPRRSPEGDQ